MREASLIAILPKTSNSNELENNSDDTTSVPERVDSKSFVKTRSVTEKSS